MNHRKLMVTGRIKILLFASVFIFCGCSVPYTGRAGSKDVFVQKDVFVSGSEGYDTFRIPAIAVTKKGTVGVLKKPRFIYTCSIFLSCQ